MATYSGPIRTFIRVSNIIIFSTLAAILFLAWVGARNDHSFVMEDAAAEFFVREEAAALGGCP